ncbi:hypothetical protein WUBG_18502, partial [Wuchereria bancrofti]
EQYLADTMQEALMRHFNGIEFVERNAGPRIDEHMQEQGIFQEISNFAKFISEKE